MCEIVASRIRHVLFACRATSPPKLASTIVLIRMNISSLESTYLRISPRWTEERIQLQRSVERKSSALCVERRDEKLRAMEPITLIRQQVRAYEFFCASPKRVSITADFHSPFCVCLFRSCVPSSWYNNAVVEFLLRARLWKMHDSRCECVVRGKGNINGSHLCVKNDNDISKARSLIIGFALASGVVATPRRSFGACLPGEIRFAGLLTETHRSATPSEMEKRETLF